MKRKIDSLEDGDVIRKRRIEKTRLGENDLSSSASSSDGENVGDIVEGINKEDHYSDSDSEKEALYSMFKEQQAEAKIFRNSGKIEEVEEQDEQKEEEDGSSDEEADPSKYIGGKASYSLDYDEAVINSARESAANRERVPPTKEDVTAAIDTLLQHLKKSEKGETCLQRLYVIVKKTRKSKKSAQPHATPRSDAQKAIEDVAQAVAVLSEYDDVNGTDVAQQRYENLRGLRDVYSGRGPA